IDLSFFCALNEIHREVLERIAGDTFAPLLIRRDERRSRDARRRFADAVRKVGEYVELVHALTSKQINGLRAFDLIKGREHLSSVDFLTSRALGVQLRILDDALQ